MLNENNNANSNSNDEVLSYKFNVHESVVDPGEIVSDGHQGDNTIPSSSEGETTSSDGNREPLQDKMIGANYNHVPEQNGQNAVSNKIPNQSNHVPEQNGQNAFSNGNMVPNQSNQIPEQNGQNAISNGNMVPNQSNQMNANGGNQIDNSNYNNQQQPSSRQQVDNAIDGAGSQFLQKAGVPKGLSDKVVKSNGGMFNPGNLPGNKMVSNNVRNGIAKTMDNNKSSDGLGNRIQNAAGKKLLSKVNPALGAISDKVSGSKEDQQQDNSQLNNNDGNNNQNESNEVSGATEAKAVVSKAAKLFMIFGGSGFFVLIFLCVVVVSAIAYHKIGGLKLADNTSATDSGVQQNIQKNASKMGDDDFDAGLNDSAYLDIYDDSNTEGNVNVVLVSSSTDITFENLSDMFGGNYECNPDSGICIDDAEVYFFLKMYDLYYVYLTKYNVKLDLPLLMATIVYKSSDIPVTLTQNIGGYDRQQVIDCDWGANDCKTGLDWDFEINSLNNIFTNNDSVIFSNDGAFDLQLLARNMVTRTVEEKCKKEDGSYSSSKKVVNSEPDLECGEGEELVYENASYVLDYDKYDEFLVEYIDKKYYSTYFAPFPNYLFYFGKLPTTDKEPSIIKKLKDKKKSKKNPTNDADVDSSVIEKLISIGLKQEGKGPTEYRTWFHGYDKEEDWCAIFVSWLFDQVGGLDKYIIKTNGAGTIPRCSSKEGSSDGYDCSKEADLGVWYESEYTDSSTVPKPGDIIVFVNNNEGRYSDNDKFYSDHVGFVYKVDDERVYTIEGNTGSLDYNESYVSKNDYDRKSGHINGYFRPYYPTDTNNSKKITSNLGSDPNALGVAMVEVAQEEYEKFNRGETTAWTYQSSGGLGSSDPWCAAFVSYVADHTYIDENKKVSDIVGQRIIKGAGVYLRHFEDTPGLNFIFNDSCS